ncbi:Clp protease N-terminal domain-containing protein [Nitrospira sp. CMX1]
MDMNRMTLKLQEALQAASANAMRRSHQGIDIEHLLLALMEQETGLPVCCLNRRVSLRRRY